MRPIILCVGLILAAWGCQAPSAPRPFTLGPGCWTITTVHMTLDDGRAAQATVKAHYPVCPDSMAEGQTLWHWDTVYVSH